MAVVVPDFGSVKISDAVRKGNAANGVMSFRHLLSEDFKAHQGRRAGEGCAVGHVVVCHQSVWNVHEWINGSSSGLVRRIFQAVATGLFRLPVILAWPGAEPAGLTSSVAG